jgi:hypothetical protein
MAAVIAVAMVLAMSRWHPAQRRHSSRVWPPISQKVHHSYLSESVYVDIDSFNGVDVDDSIRGWVDVDGFRRFNAIQRDKNLVTRSHLHLLFSSPCPA